MKQFRKLLECRHKKVGCLPSLIFRAILFLRHQFCMFPHLVTMESHINTGRSLLDLECLVDMFKYICLNFKTIWFPIWLTGGHLEKFCDNRLVLYIFTRGLHYSSRKCIVVVPVWNLKLWKIQYTHHDHRIHIQPVIPSNWKVIMTQDRHCWEELMKKTFYFTRQWMKFVYIPLYM